jgi:hypothetical protein
VPQSTETRTLQLPRPGPSSRPPATDLDPEVVAEYLSQTTTIFSVGDGTPEKLLFFGCRRCTTFVHPGYFRMYLAEEPEATAPPAAVVEVHPCVDARGRLIGGRERSSPISGNGTNSSTAGLGTLARVYVEPCVVGAHGFSTSGDVIQAVNASVWDFERNASLFSFFSAAATVVFAIREDNEQPTSSNAVPVREERDDHVDL